jgi:hypothetical protein
MALAAADRGDYEAFHDLAWRAVQTGPAKDPALMYLLARAQALSGRPHDALVMLQRLADLGVRSDAATNDDFRRIRDLPGWPEVSASIDRVPRSDAPPAAANPAAAAKPAATAKPSAATKPAAAPLPAAATPATAATPAAAAPPAAARGTVASPVPPVTSPPLEAARFTTGGFAVGGLAYDAVSGRFLLGDRLGRKLIVVGDGADHAVDFVRAASAGFHDISAVEIDARRGDLWVASAAPAEGGGTLHKLQLVSGRPLRSFSAAADLEPLTPVDLAVTPAGAVLVLDSAARQLLVLRVGAASLERAIGFEAHDLTSVTATDDEAIAYVAHRDGISRIDLRARTATPVATPGPASRSHPERIRWYRHALIAILADDDGTRRIMRFELNPSGRAITQAKTIEAAVPAVGPAFATVSGDQLVYLVDSASPAADRPPGMAEFVAYRINLR